MAYLLENETSKIKEDIFKRKEFNRYYLTQKDHNHDHDTENIIPRFLISKMISDNNYLQFHSYQLFVSNYINPNTPYSRLLMKWQTGTGKSIGALSIALNFIKYFQLEHIQEGSNIGSVFIIGFTSNVFRNELLRHPEFGIISRKEIIKLNTLKKNAYNGGKYNKEILQEFMMKLKKKFNNRENNGFFQFIGYKKLVNMLFIINSPDINLNNMDENSIKNAIDDKKIKLNLKLMDEFKNSLIICDEIHNVYNSLEKNNWGIALQYILNYHSSIRAVFMSATPINNNPSEVIDLLNLLLPSTYYPDKLVKSDFFESNNTLKKGALDKISNLCSGRISYLRDVNPKYFPSRHFIGEKIKNVPYLKFIRCPMNDLHYNTYENNFKGSLNFDSRYISDFIVPNPNNNKIGLYQTNDVRSILSAASQKWKDDNLINFKKGRIVGDILNIKNLHKMSNKYLEMMKTVNEIITNKKGKLFIYHNTIRMSGVLFIQEILLNNNIISETGVSTDNTLCVLCGEARKTHKVEQLGGRVKHPTEITLQSNNMMVNYNFNVSIYEVYNSSKNGIPLLEYFIYDGIIIIPYIFININKSNESYIKNIFKLLSDEYEVIIQLPEYKIDTMITDIIQNFGFNLLHTNKLYETEDKPEFNGYKYYSNLDMKFNRQNIINHIERHICNRNKTNNISGGSSNKNLPDKNHTFIPVRFITVHSEIEKSSMNNSLEKFNSPDNSDGHRIMILVGSRIIKEAYDIKAVRELFIMGRPDNIPTLIQIIGRAVRKNSHKYLQENKKNVNIRIFTSCLPTKKNGEYELSYEETKYAEKLKHYKIIQNIEKTLHENAIDAVINKDIIWNKEEQRLNTKLEPSLGPLYFEPNINKSHKKIFKLNELNLQTFNAFNTNSEINDIIIIIKRLFLEKSPVWNYEDLLYSVKESHKTMDIEFNTNLINEELFIVALSRLVWSNDKNYTEPVISSNDTSYQSVINVVDKIFDTEDKIITLPGNQKSVIAQVGLYYMLFPIDELNNEPIKSPEIIYRINKKKKIETMDIKNFLESDNTITKYNDKRDRFFNKWNNVDIDKLEMAVCDFGTDFHVQLLEECIEYIFNVWTDPKIKKSVMHSFYFKMVNYYDLRKLVSWGHTIKPSLFTKYNKYLKQVSVKIKKNKNDLEDIDVKKDAVETSGIINLLKSSINRSDINWVSSGTVKEYEDKLANSLKLFDGNYKKNTKQNEKIDADLVPVGHFLTYIPKFYHPDNGWYESPEYLKNTEDYIENNIIIGYDERSKTGVHIRFKIRTPIQNIKHFKDSRLIEKGSVCSSKSKVYLMELSRKLGIKPKKKINVTDLCNDIRTKLIYYELKERVAKSKKKFFYAIYEKRPEISIDENL